MVNYHLKISQRKPVEIEKANMKHVQLVIIYSINNIKGK